MWQGFKMVVNEDSRESEEEKAHNIKGRLVGFSGLNIQGAASFHHNGIHIF